MATCYNHQGTFKKISISWLQPDQNHSIKIAGKGPENDTIQMFPPEILMCNSGWEPFVLTGHIETFLRRNMCCLEIRLLLPPCAFSSPQGHPEDLLLKKTRRMNTLGELLADRIPFSLNWGQDAFLFMYRSRESQAPPHTPLLWVGTFLCPTGSKWKTHPRQNQFLSSEREFLWLIYQCFLYFIK